MQRKAHMIKDYSYGIVPLRFKNHLWQVLLIQHQAGHWAFPKGHADLGESPQQAAERELYEETGVKVQRYLLPDPLIETYIFTSQGQRIYKTVHYFLALVTDKVVIQEVEVQASEWLTLPEALVRVNFKETKRLCLQVNEFLTHLTHQE